MTALRSSSTSMPLSVARKFRVAAVVLVAAATLAACAPSADDESDDAASSSTTVEESTGDEGTSDSSGGGYTSDDVGNGTLTVNGVEFPDFDGDCEIGRNSGIDDVGDLNEGDIQAIIAIDNVSAHEESSMSFVAINEESFTFRDPMGAAGVGGSRWKGEITTMTELSPRTADGSRDLVEVRFSGVLEDGTTVDADIVCELQNAFS